MILLLPVIAVVSLHIHVVSLKLQFWLLIMLSKILYINQTYLLTFKCHYWKYISRNKDSVLIILKDAMHHDFTFILCSYMSWMFYSQAVICYLNKQFVRHTLHYEIPYIVYIVINILSYKERGWIIHQLRWWQTV